MPNTILIPSAQNLPDGFCPQTWQSTVDAFAAAMRVTLPTSASQIVISQTAPPPAEQDRIWFQVDANNHVLAIKSFDQGTGDWERVDDIPYYFNNIGSVNDLEITTGDSINLLNDVGGRLFIVKAFAANSSTAPTLTVDACPATVIKKNGSEALQAGNITAGMLCILIYDGTQFQLLNPKFILPANSYLSYYNESPIFACPANGIAQEWLHGLAAIPSFYHCYLICRVANIGYDPGDRVSYLQAQVFAGTFEHQCWTLAATTSNLRFIGQGDADYFQIPNKSTGRVAIADYTKWDIQFVVSKFFAA